MFVLVSIVSYLFLSYYELKKIIIIDIRSFVGTDVSVIVFFRWNRENRI